MSVRGGEWAPGHPRSLRLHANGGETGTGRPSSRWVATLALRSTTTRHAPDRRNNVGPPSAGVPRISAGRSVSRAEQHRSPARRVPGKRRAMDTERPHFGPWARFRKFPIWADGSPAPTGTICRSGNPRRHGVAGQRLAVGGADGCVASGGPPWGWMCLNQGRRLGGTTIRSCL